MVLVGGLVGVNNFLALLSEAGAEGGGWNVSCILNLNDRLCLLVNHTPVLLLNGATGVCGPL